jgi:hypothetical protein
MLLLGHGHPARGDTGSDLVESQKPEPLTSSDTIARLREVLLW